MHMINLHESIHFFARMRSKDGVKRRPFADDLQKLIQVCPAITAGLRASDHRPCSRQCWSPFQGDASPWRAVRAGGKVVQRAGG
jgi:hypothetical protein